MGPKGIFDISSKTEFETKCLEIFQFQYQNNGVYQRFCDYLNVKPERIDTLTKIPFLPIQFFKEHKVVSTLDEEEIIFTSSGTTGSVASKHYVTDLSLYKQSYLKGFESSYGPIKNYCVLALLPSYLERDGSSLIYMVNDLINKSKHPFSGFFLNDLPKLESVLRELEAQKQKTLLIGVSFALLDFAETFKLELEHTIVMETGGMKGRRKELIRKELHEQLKRGFGVKQIHSEYGMTELLSQAYSLGDSLFNCPPWMKILVRDTEDPLSLLPIGKTGGINVIDLANVNSCSFIATQDLGKLYESGKFEVLGRFDHSDIRGCNLMAL
ncbi:MULTISPECIES: acyl transferase [Maribacter]|uniref:Acyl transferase n=1 Tax=Maribacter flavus TaxID=1658664 RepID=A0A5B2TZT8_9FLAO|nr:MULTISPECIES: acyl transferase [Maribacter]KAA2219593.1 acyl transferase [Maribacter flavus]MDC6404549.1 acyl transferase [Maribacter sp. PR66]MEE1971692.1 acyl transferase [Maribacter flavus]